ncbi:hypothetical protein PV726_31720 [Streptomyces europaeiscabiei]|uniref:hypothetical protein n=1 Tax=Streptomyces europaeiscabiei TaxID=146819 RepID=UPI0029A667C8|nr:hypothetical protein [Streptomyces europaeiscabiei]MDX3694823.1 hypothetical protein [Streptomyces europaeiscabiei]
MDKPEGLGRRENGGLEAVTYLYFHGLGRSVDGGKQLDQGGVHAAITGAFARSS